MSHIPTDDELAAMRARAYAAYPFERGGYFDIEDCTIGFTPTFSLIGALVNDEQKVKTDKMFIDNARRDVLTLLAEVERLRAENASLRESLDLSDLIINSEAVK